MNAIIGTNGLIGNYLKGVIEYTHEFNSIDIQQIAEYEFDTVYVAAPTGNRIKANADPTADLDNIRALAKSLMSTKFNTIVLIGTVDSRLRPNLPYGKHRLWLEDFVKTEFSDYYIPRLSSLIYKDIKKNPLYDLKHNVYTDKINLDYILQWYDLTNLKSDIDKMILTNTREKNLVSVPVTNREIVERFFPSLNLTRGRIEGTEILLPFSYSREEIFESISQYLNV